MSVRPLWSVSTRYLDGDKVRVLLDTEAFFGEVGLMVLLLSPFDLLTIHGSKILLNWKNNSRLVLGMV